MVMMVVRLIVVVAALLILRQVALIAHVPGTFIKHRGVGTFRIKTNYREKMLNQQRYLQVPAPAGASGSDGAGWLSLGRKAQLQTPTKAGNSEGSLAPALARCLQ